MSEYPTDQPATAATPLGTSLSSDTVAATLNELICGRPIPDETLVWLGAGPFGDDVSQVLLLVPHWRQRPIAVTLSIGDALKATDYEFGDPDGHRLVKLAKALGDAMRTVAGPERLQLSPTYIEATLALALLRPLDHGRPLTALASAYALNSDMPIDRRMAAAELALGRLAVLPVNVAGASVAFAPFRTTAPAIDPAVVRRYAVPLAIDRHRRAASHLIAGVIDAELAQADNALARLAENAAVPNLKDPSETPAKPSLGAPVPITDLATVRRVLAERMDGGHGSRTERKPFLFDLRASFGRLLRRDNASSAPAVATDPDFAAIWRRHAEPEGARSLDELTFGGAWAGDVDDYRAFLGDPEPAIQEIKALGLPAHAVPAIIDALRSSRHNRLVNDLALRALEKALGFMGRSTDVEKGIIGTLILGAHATRLTVVEGWHGAPAAQWRVASSLAAMALGADADPDAARSDVWLSAAAMLRLALHDRSQLGVGYPGRAPADASRDPVMVDTDGEIMIVDDGARRARADFEAKVADAVEAARPRPFADRLALARAALGWAMLAGSSEPIAGTEIGARLLLGPERARGIGERHRRLETAGQDFDALIARGREIQLIEPRPVETLRGVTSGSQDVPDGGPLDALELIAAARVTPDDLRRDRLYANAEATRAANGNATEVATKPPKPPSAPGVVVIERVTDGKTSHIKELLGPWRSLIGKPIPLATTPDLRLVRQRLIAIAPHAVEPIDRILTMLASSPTLRLPPVLLVGSPGSGKSRLAMALGQLIGAKPIMVACGGLADASFIGTSRQWSTARPSTPLEAIRSAGIANPMVILDELEKVATGSHNGSLLHGLLAFLEPGSSTAVMDLMLEAPVDLSRILYVATANDLDRIAGPLRDRFRVLTYPDPGPEHLDALLPGIVAEVLAREEGRRLVLQPIAPPDPSDPCERTRAPKPRDSSAPADDGHQVAICAPEDVIEEEPPYGDVDAVTSIPAIEPPLLDAMERAAIAAHWKGGSIRALARYVEAVLAARRAPPFLH